MSDEKDELIKGLRKVADFLEATEFNENGSGFGFVDVYLFNDGPAFWANVKKLGSFNKQFDSYFAAVTKHFSSQVKFTINTSRENVCEKVKVGVEVIPAQPERVVAATPEQVVDKYEYKCPESLLGGHNA